MKTMHLFAGIGGGLLGDLILGHTPIIAVEWDNYACRVLRKRAADGWFPALSVWEGDVALFNPSEYTDRVDCIHAGFPCQDISVAGKQAGLGEGTRSGLYREVLRIAGVVRPRYIFMENVASIISQREKITLIIIEKLQQLGLFGSENSESWAGRYLRREVEANGQAAIGFVLGDMAAMGYNCRWCCVLASDVGAPHGRDRWWCLAELADTAGERLSERGQPGRTPGTPEAGAGLVAELERCSTEVAYTQRDRLQGGREGWGTTGQAGLCGGARGDEEQDLCNAGDRETKSDLGGMADGNPDKLYADWWEVEPHIGRVTNISTNRRGRLMGLGNAQVPLQSALAFTLLMCDGNNPVPTTF